MTTEIIVTSTKLTDGPGGGLPAGSLGGGGGLPGGAGPAFGGGAAGGGKYQPRSPPAPKPAPPAHRPVDTSPVHAIGTDIEVTKVTGEQLTADLLNRPHVPSSAPPMSEFDALIAREPLSDFEKLLQGDFLPSGGTVDNPGVNTVLQAATDKGSLTAVEVLGRALTYANPLLDFLQLLLTPSQIAQEQNRGITYAGEVVATASRLPKYTTRDPKAKNPPRGPIEPAPLPYLGDTPSGTAVQPGGPRFNTRPGTAVAPRVAPQPKPRPTPNPLVGPVTKPTVGVLPSGKPQPQTRPQPKPQPRPALPPVPLTPPNVGPLSFTSPQPKPATASSGGGRQCDKLPGRKKGKCRTGHFRERSDGTFTFTVWTEDNCTRAQDPNQPYTSHRKRGPHDVRHPS